MTLTIAQRKAIKAMIPTSYVINGINFTPTIKYWNQIEATEPDYRIVIKEKMQNIENLRDITNQINWPKVLISFNIYSKDYYGTPNISGGIIVWEIARQLTKNIEETWDTALSAYDIRVASFGGGTTYAGGMVYSTGSAVGPIVDLSELVYDRRKTKQSEYRVQFDLTLMYRFRP